MRKILETYKRNKNRAIGGLLFVFTTVVGVRTPAPLHPLPGPLIVSLTSYRPRFSTLRPTIISLLNQSVRPDKLILWVSHSDRPLLPKNITDLVKHGLIIRDCDDIRSYKKIVPALREYPDAVHVTADDDVYYWRTWLQELVSAHQSDLRRVICHRAHKITFGADGNPGPYLDWEHNAPPQGSVQTLFPTGIGGILYPPGVFHPDVTNEDAFRALCPTADDVWLYWMARRNGALVTKVGRPRSIYSWPGSQSVGLHAVNTRGLNQNDVQIQNMIKEFGWPA